MSRQNMVRGKWLGMLAAAGAALLLCTLLPTYIFHVQEREILRQVRTEDYEMIEISLRKSMEGKSLIEKFLFLQEPGVEYMQNTQMSDKDDEQYWRIQEKIQTELYTFYGNLCEGAPAFTRAGRYIAVDMDDPGRALNVWKAEYIDDWTGTVVTAVLDESTGKLIDIWGYEQEYTGDWYAYREAFIYAWFQYIGAYSCDVADVKVWADGYIAYEDDLNAAISDTREQEGKSGAQEWAAAAEEGTEEGASVSKEEYKSADAGTGGKVTEQMLESWGIPPEYMVLLEVTGINGNEYLSREEILMLIENSLYAGEWAQLKLAVYTADETYYVDFHNSPIGFGFS